MQTPELSDDEWDRLIVAAPRMFKALQGAMVIIDTLPIPEGASVEFEHAYKKRREAILSALAEVPSLRDKADNA